MHWFFKNPLKITIVGVPHTPPKNEGKQTKYATKIPIFENYEKNATNLGY